jgi:hypothetical protein
MAVNRCSVDAPVADVLGVLADASAYPRWVVGPREAVAVDPTWPDPGSGFLHESLRGPFAVRDRTEVVRFDRDRGEVVLEAHSGPLGVALVRITVGEAGERTRVTLEEDALSGPLRLLPKPVRDVAIHTRNRRAIRRLRRMVESGTWAP